MSGLITLPAGYDDHTTFVRYSVALDPRGPSGGRLPAEAMPFGPSPVRLGPPAQISHDELCDDAGNRVAKSCKESQNTVTYLTLNLEHFAINIPSPL
jgi:hypothetical protein